MRGGGGSSGLATNLLVAQRARLHIGYRVAIRVFESLNGIRQGGVRSRRFHQQFARLPLDIVVGTVLRRVKGEWLVPRLSLDAADIATSSLTQGDLYFAASWLGVPLALEAGVRRRMAGLIVPAVNAVTTAAVRRRRGLRLKPTTFGWQVLAVLGGSAIRSYLDHERRVAAALHDEVVAAECEMARLGGRNSVATRADTIVDILIRTAPILETSETRQGTIQQMLSSWKALLARETEQHAVYLKTALDRWRRRHNEQPDLSRDVYFDLPSEQWTVLLSRTQAQELEHALDGLDLRAIVRTSVIDDDRAHRPGEPLEMHFERFRVTVPPDEVQRPRSFDLGPAALCLAAVLCAMSSLPTQGAAPLRRVTPAVGWFLGTGLWAQRKIAKTQGNARDHIFLACAFGSVINTATITGALRSPKDENGLVRQTYLGPLLAELPLAFLYRDSLSRTTKIVAGIATAISVIAGVRISKSQLKDIVGGLVWPIAALIIFRGLADAVDAEISAFENDLASSDTRAVSRAFATGQRDVMDLVTPAHHSLRSLLNEDQLDHLSEADIVEVRRRLDDVEQRLLSLEGTLSGVGTENLISITPLGDICG